MDKIEVIAFYLPQYYPTKENDAWYGPGFTEWTNVGKARPLFKGHYQPKVPADLGYYDLRLSQVREQQAELAREAGISAFCYYHYWFGNGVQMLDMPLKEVVRLKTPDFPFCICWANHSWYKKTWDPTTNTLNHTPLVRQEYPGEKDFEEHFYSLLDCFKDKRYFRVDGKLLFMVYHIDEMPNADLFVSKWQEMARKEGLPPFLFVGYADDVTRIKNPSFRLCTYTAISCKDNIDAIGNSHQVRRVSAAIKRMVSRYLKIPLNKWEYASIRNKLVIPEFKQEEVIPVLYPNWDNTPRRGEGALILHHSTPKQFYLHCKDVFSFVAEKNNKLVVLKSWNEWGEGNYMEPCLKYGHGYIASLRKALNDRQESREKR
jgi:hypothetical protein